MDWIDLDHNTYERRATVDAAMNPPVIVASLIYSRKFLQRTYHVITITHSAKEVQTGSGPPSLLFNDTRRSRPAPAHPMISAILSRGGKLTTSLHLLPRLRISAAMLLMPPYVPHMACGGTS